LLPMQDSEAPRAWTMPNFHDSMQKMHEGKQRTQQRMCTNA
jgi:hypothetical protein